MQSVKHKNLPHYVYDDYVKWEGRWELIYGIPYAMSPAPTMYHQGINTRILNELGRRLENCKDCVPYMYLDFKVADDTVLQPDALVVCKPFEEAAFLTKVPHIIFEILSPATRKKDLIEKHAIYEQAGVKYYVIVDPLKKQCRIYQLMDRVYKLIVEISEGSFEFNNMACAFLFDFGRIW